MSSQLENLRKAITQESLRFREIEDRAGYINVMVEISPDSIAASLLLSSYFITHNKPFTLRFIDPFMVFNGQVKPSPGTTFFIGYTGLPPPKNYSSFEISCYSDAGGNILNPYVFGLNGVLVGSNTTLTYLFLKELGYNAAELSSIILGGILSSQASPDPGKLSGLNKAVFEDLKKGSLELSNSLKIPTAEGLDLSVALSLMIEPFVLGISGDQKGSALLIQELVRRKQLSKSSGIITGSDARVLFDEFSKIRVQNNFKEIDEESLLGSVYMDTRHPVDSPLRNIFGNTLALEACANMRAYTPIFKLFIYKKKEMYGEILEIMLNYSSSVALLTRQLLQNQEYFRETQNALYVFAPPQTQSGLILRAAKTLSQSKAFNTKTIVIVSSTTNNWSRVAGYSGFQASNIDLGSTFKSAAERLKGMGYGSSIEAVAYIPTPYVESFFDDVDVRLRG